MSGGSFKHAAISGNSFPALRSRLRDKPCTAMNSDMRVHTPAGLDTYPDVSVFRGGPELSDQQRTLLNPVLIIEVLSPSTRTYDRGDKFALYRSIPSLRDYLLIDSEKAALEHFRRDNNGEWILHEYSAMEDVIPLPAIDVELPVRDIYEGVVFEG